MDPDFPVFLTKKNLWPLKKLRSLCTVHLLSWNPFPYMVSQQTNYTMENWTVIHPEYTPLSGWFSVLRCPDQITMGGREWTEYNSYLSSSPRAWTTQKWKAKKLLVIICDKANRRQLQCTCSVVDPDPESDPVGSETFCRIRIQNKSFRIRIRASFFYFPKKLMLQKALVYILKKLYISS